MKVLVTGAAGFIGYHVALTLLRRGDEVCGVDSLNTYYDPTLKAARISQLDASGPAFRFAKMNLADHDAVDSLFRDHSFDRVIHLAAQAGVRYSLEDPRAYVESNLTGFTNVLEACRHNKVSHLVYASTSSVYGANTTLPFSEHHSADHPLQFYAATKRANELMAHSYSHLFDLPTTGLRFFTVYGPWGRPDMALFSFTKAIIAGEPIRLFNGGNHIRDFTYVSDIVDGVIRASDQIATSDPNWNSDAPDSASSRAPFRIFNVGNNSPVELLRYVSAIEGALGQKAKYEMLPMQPGDVHATAADVTELRRATGYQPTTSVEVGVERFVAWYLGYYGANEMNRTQTIS